MSGNAFKFDLSKFVFCLVKSLWLSVASTAFLRCGGDDSAVGYYCCP